MSRAELRIMACVFCKDPQFHDWIRLLCEEAGKEDFPPGEEGAKAFITTICDIESRNELDTNKEAAKAFHTLIRAPFVTWKARQRAEGIYQ